jgi:hypothetical protein
MSGEPDQIDAWRAVGSRFGIEVNAPCEITLSDGSRFNATALVRVGPPNGMVVDPRWATLEPYADRLVSDGFGFSAVAIDGDLASVVEMLKDWGWTA